MTVSKIAMVFDIQWIDLIYSSLWIILIIGVYNFVLVSTAMGSGRRKYIKNEVPYYQDGIIKDLRIENKMLKKELTI
ncbi:MAG: hypothetical protein PF693_10905 [Spirochaetia bacterium]|jgi:hypothetical protein|nr:hypothetical protein [Spirochaetia bacterium]